MVNCEHDNKVSIDTNLDGHCPMAVGRLHGRRDWVATTNSGGRHHEELFSSDPSVVLDDYESTSFMTQGESISEWLQVAIICLAYYFEEISLLK